MKTRFSSLVNLKKNIMQKSELAVKKTIVDLNSATEALERSYRSLSDIQPPKSGNMKEMIASRMLLHSQNGIIHHNKEWVDFATRQVQEAKDQLKRDMIEHEKFKYLELEEIKKLIKEQKIQETKDMDEAGLMAYSDRSNKKGSK